MVLAEQTHGKLHRITYELLGKAVRLARKADAPVWCALVGPAGMDTGELIARGAQKVFYCAGDLFREPDEYAFTRGFEAAIRLAGPTVCLVGATGFGRSMAPRLAAALGTGLTADCTGLEIDDDGRLVQIRPAFSENILAHIKTDTLPQMATVRYKEFEEAARDGNRRGEVVDVPVPSIPINLTQTARELSAAKESISDAEIIVAAGRGVRDAQGMALVRQLAQLLDGRVGASRSLVDDGVIGHEAQVGYSGSRVKPKLYIACGISGAPQHVAGMKESGYIAAINSDPSAPIFRIADLGICADLYEVLPRLIERIQETRKAPAVNS